MRRREFLAAFAATIAAVHAPAGVYGLASIKQATRAAEDLQLPTSDMPAGHLVQVLIRPLPTAKGTESRPLNVIAKYFIVGDDGKLHHLNGSMVSKAAYPKLWAAVNRAGMVDPEFQPKDRKLFRLPDMRTNMLFRVRN